MLERPRPLASSATFRGTSCSSILGGGEGPQVTPIRTGRYQWLIREWRVNDTASFDAELQCLMREVDPSATLLQLSLLGITSMTDRVAILGRIEHDLRHRFRHLVLHADDLVARPSDDDHRPGTVPNGAIFLSLVAAARQP
jgi:hypothetical protein